MKAPPQRGRVDVVTRGEVLEPALQARDYLVSSGVPGALSAKDPALWGPGQGRAAPQHRLGWLDVPQTSRHLLPGLEQLVTAVHRADLQHIVLVGMGGAALAAAAITEDSGVSANLTVLDDLDPGRLAGVIERLDRTLVIVSSKEGTAIEADAYWRIFSRAFADAGLSTTEIARRFVIVTDPTTPLESMAKTLGYRLALTDPSVPGHFGALSAYGLIPAALAGVNVVSLLDQAAAVRPMLAGAEDNPGLLLGAILGGCALPAPQGTPRDKVVFRAPGLASPLAGWLEQLLVGATAKQGRGILPVDSVGWPLMEPCPDAHSMALNTDATLRPGPETMQADTLVTGPLGGQFLTWEYAAAIAAWMLGVDPFDATFPAPEADNDTAAFLRRAGGGPLPIGEPTFTRGVVAVYADSALAHGAQDITGVLEALLRAVPVTGYLAITSYTDPGVGVENLVDTLAGATFRPVTYTPGPRSSYGPGQYHKEGPGGGVFLVITGDTANDLPVPGRPYTLGTLRMARGLADVRALRRRRLPVVWAHLRDPATGAAQLRSAAEQAG